MRNYKTASRMVSSSTDLIKNDIRLRVSMPSDEDGHLGMQRPHGSMRWATLAAGEQAQLREQGVFQRIWVDTIENLVGIFEKLAGAAFRAHVNNAALVLKGKGNIFQRLDDCKDRRAPRVCDSSQLPHLNG